MNEKPIETPARSRFAYTDPNDIVIIKYGKTVKGTKKRVNKRHPNAGRMVEINATFEFLTPVNRQ